MIPFVCIFAVLIVPAYLASNSNSYYYGSSHMFGEETQMGSDIQKVEAVFGKSDTYVLLVPQGDTASEKALSGELNTVSEITSIISYVDMAGAEIPREFLDEDTLSLLESEHYSRMVLTVDADYEGEQTFALVKNIRAIAQKYYPDTWYLAGEGVSTYDLMDTVTADMVKVNAVAIAAVTVSVMTSGSVLTVVGFLLGYLSSNQLLAQLGMFLGVGAICSMVIVLFVLLGLLYTFDKLFIKQPGKVETKEAAQSGS